MASSTRSPTRAQARHVINRFRVAVLWLLALLLTAPVCARPALWAIHRGAATVYLFGSVHLLPNDTDWRFPALAKALADSQSLTIEITDDDPASVQARVLQYGLDTTHPLSDMLSAGESATLAEAARSAEVPGGVATLQRMRPWLAAVTLAVAPLVKAGLDPEHGVDKQLKAQMLAAGKPVYGLETSEQQIRFLAELPPAVQLSFLRATLRDFGRGSDELTTLIAAWKAGDIAAIARIEDEELRREEPALYQGLLVQRNQAWAGKIIALLQHPGTTFIAVGAAHLAGPDSVQVQLAKVGILAQPQ